VSAAVAFVLRDYALIADGERGALIDPHGNLAWLCAPRWHDPAICSSLLGGRGAYRVTPIERFVWGGSYEPGTLIWRSRWVTQNSIIECHEALALPARTGELVLLRRLHAIQGTARVEIALHLRGEYDRAPMDRLRLDADGRWHGRTGRLHFSWGGAQAARRRRGEGLIAALELEPGTRHDLVLRIAAEPPGPTPQPATLLWETTVSEWRRRVPALPDTIAPRDARHALAVLHGLTSASGGLVAAATMALPERADQGRDYDYRYAWIRDGCYAGQAAAAVEDHELLQRIVRFTCERVLADGPELKPAYTIQGAPVPAMADTALPGYPGGGRQAGNRVRSQFQLDTLGEILQLIACAARLDGLDEDGWQAAHLVADAISQRAQQADAGVWELAPARWTHSRLSCVAGLSAISQAAGTASRRTEWLALADQLRASCASECVHPDGHWQRAPGDPRVDAALLLPGMRGALAPEDPRTVLTIAAVHHQLAEDGYLYRFRHDQRPLGHAEGAFLLCGLWMALALADQEQREPALRWFERSRAACGPPGLFSEEYDVAQRQLRGNLPQAFVHAQLLECAVRIA
jgi:GH15 family glucan-1,4-alpha-glucosidase